MSEILVMQPCWVGFVRVQCLLWLKWEEMDNLCMKIVKVATVSAFRATCDSLDPIIKFGLVLVQNRVALSLICETPHWINGHLK